MYNSFLICDHEKIICFYLSGKEVAIFHKDTKQLEIKNKEYAVQLQKQFFYCSLMLELNIDKAA
jgi:hypothetical protein